MNVIDIIAIAAANMTALEALIAIVANVVVCAGIAWACVCRARNTSARTTRPEYRYLYAAAGTLSVLAALAWPWLGPWPHLGLLACYLIGLGLASRSWRDGPSPAASKPTLRRVPWNP